MRVRIFTDGACSENPGPGGWAAVFNTATGCKVLSGNECQTTNNRMELMAMVQAMELIHNKGKRENQYEIYSDSAYVVNSINKGWVEVWRDNGWVTTRNDKIKNRDLWQQYIDVKQSLIKAGIDLTIIKVKGHSGDASNEYADKMAKEEVLKAKALLSEKRGGRRA